MTHLTMNNLPMDVAEGTSILEAAREAGIHIPTLCHHKDLCVAGNCRVCVVEVEGQRALQAACALPASEGMKVFTNSARVRSARQIVIELLLSEHRSDCLKCYRNGNCELQDLAYEYRVEERTFLDLATHAHIDRSSLSIIKDDSKCIRCQRCVRTCDELQKVSALTVAHKGKHMKIETFFANPLYDVVCSTCGQCVNRCPTGALVEHTVVDDVWAAIENPELHVIVQTAPAVRVSIGEELGYDPGSRVTGKMVTALRRLGFDKVFDTDFAADLTIIEEGSELLQRLKNVLVNGRTDVALPMITSCSPGWVKFLEHLFPDRLNHLSTCKSPQQMFGALAKTWYARRMKIAPEKIVVVSIMPCTAKKYEAARPEMRGETGLPDVDYVLTTRELGRMIRQAGLDFRKLVPEDYDSMMGHSTGAGVIFGSTGGVMEAALRTVHELVTGREVPFEHLDVLPVRGMEGVRQAVIPLHDCLPAWEFLNGVELKVAVAHGLNNAWELMRTIEAGNSGLHFVEVMACPGGCLGGGGQPIPTDLEIRKERMKAIFAEDSAMTLRKSHNNPDVMRLYEEFLHVPLGESSHKLLHTSYTRR
ncbi:MAG: [FeFe] hydrogenase, group A [Calditrichaeota bacterium]|nr:[FeFe] hydrogenase, group A [Calditrichota bacterium]